MTTTRATIIKIGNSRGIRIPRPVIEQAGLGSEVEIRVCEDHLQIRRASHPRAGWDAQFAAMAERGDDQLLDEPTATEWDETEWRW